MWHSEINNRPDASMRFIQMWFVPLKRGLKPSVEQKPVEKAERTITHSIPANRGVFLYVLQGGPIRVNDETLPSLGAAKITKEDLSIEARTNAEFLLMDVGL